MEDFFENLLFLENFGAAEARQDSRKAAETEFVRLRLRISECEKMIRECFSLQI